VKIHTAVLTSGERKGHVTYVNDHSEHALLLDIYEANKLEIDPPDCDHVGPPPGHDTEWWVETVEDLLNVQIALDEHYVRTPEVVVAEFDTPHFAFQGVGADEHMARMALMAGWASHSRTHGADQNYLSENRDDVVVRTIEPGKCYRDGEEIRHG